MAYDILNAVRTFLSRIAPDRPPARNAISWGMWSGGMALLLLGVNQFLGLSLAGMLICAVFLGFFAAQFAAEKRARWSWRTLGLLWLVWAVVAGAGGYSDGMETGKIIWLVVMPLFFGGFLWLLWRQVASIWRG